VSFDASWGWLTLLLLGGYHGINPGMGWLFAVALGMQEKSRKAVARALLPIAIGHGASIGTVVLAAGLAGTVVSVKWLRLPVAVILFTLGAYRLLRSRHPRWGGMQVGFRDLTIWSFLMASAHGAGFMVLPVLLGMSAQGPGRYAGSAESHMHGNSLADPRFTLAATAVHTFGYLLLTGVTAWVVYEKVGLALLRKAWVNLDLLWAAALILTGVFTLFL
jgi:hypothetical protein